MNTMIDWQVRIIDEEIQYQDLVGASSMVNGIKISLESWHKEYKELLVVIDGNKNGLYKSEEKISLALGYDSFVERLKQNYNISMYLVKSFTWSENTNNMIRILQGSGFKELTIKDDNSIIISDGNDSKINANFFTEDEKRFLCRKTKTSTYNSSGDKIIPIENIYLK